ncbi:type II toxin-antitoxin system Phd/YefM family antitoxin [Azospirillum halopraeferens]|uniref:type II toxin-antitoxin system Phd/YefM family antitoxin n=1 Tax=Azospirillum halopraeferens TaxID=34010 RepID=UPI00040DB01B|nr:type II toxin-antitoxin system prevent-host-death family antitoxin [Azospirillum halopraeferens]
MQQFTIHAAKTNLSRLIEAALRGEDVIIARGSKPMVRLVPVAQGAFKVGLLKGKLGPGPDFFEPVGDDDLDLWEGGR